MKVWVVVATFERGYGVYVNVFATKEAASGAVIPMRYELLDLGANPQMFVMECEVGE